jgi:hypothetical protein
MERTAVNPFVYKKLFGSPPQRDIARLRSTLELGVTSARV